jgi:hypothetical protein
MNSTSEAHGTMKFRSADSHKEMKRRGGRKKVFEKIMAKIF